MTNKTNEQIDQVSEILRLCECMAGDFEERNYGDAERWIRHIAKHCRDFVETSDGTLYSYEFVKTLKVKE